MTDIEMSISHNEKDNKLDLHSNCNNDVVMETQEADPLALDDEEKMDVNETNTKSIEVIVQKEVLINDNTSINDSVVPENQNKSEEVNTKVDIKNNGEHKISNDANVEENGCKDLVENNSEKCIPDIRDDSSSVVSCSKEIEVNQNNALTEQGLLNSGGKTLSNEDEIKSEVDGVTSNKNVVVDNNTKITVKEESGSEEDIKPTSVNDKRSEDVVNASTNVVESSVCSTLTNGGVDKCSVDVVERNVSSVSESHDAKDDIPKENDVISTDTKGDVIEDTLVEPKPEVRQIQVELSLEQNSTELIVPKISNHNIDTGKMEDQDKQQDKLGMFPLREDPLKSLKNAMNRHILNVAVKEEEMHLDENMESTDLEKELPASIVSIKDDTNSNRLNDARSSGESDSDEQSLHIAEENVTSADQVGINAATKNDINKSKRRRSETKRSKSDENPSKKLCRELQETYEQHDAMLADYIANTNNSTVEEIDMHTEALEAEIETLKELAGNREKEWNNILHLKKVKEEILLRLIRKKKIILLERVNQDINKTLNNKHSHNVGIPDKIDDSSAARMTKSPLNSTNKPVYISSTAVAMPITTTPYCPISMMNYPMPLDKNIHYYGNKKIVPKPVNITPNRNLYDKNGQMESFMMPMGRQGPTKDVQSIIADYRNRHPETVPRRGRRLRGVVNPQSPQIAMGPRHLAPNPSDHSMDLGMFLSRMENNPHMSVSEAMASQHNSMLQQIPTSIPNGMSFKDVLVQFANMSGNGAGQLGNNGMGPNLPPPPPYPEVTLHPVGNTVKVTPIPQPPQNQQLPQLPTANQQNNSLLHGILTKQQPKQQDNRFSTFSPTLARLLTAPEKNTPSTNTPTSTSIFAPQKNCMEITITPVPQANQSMNSRVEPEVVHLDDYDDPELEEDSAERPLVIDEEGADKESGAVELNESEVPECQGCHRKEAQFVCAGCANQWYCSRECQVSAWDEHSEMCSG